MENNIIIEHLNELASKFNFNSWTAEKLFERKSYLASLCVRNSCDKYLLDQEFYNESILSERFKEIADERRILLIELWFIDDELLLRERGNMHQQ